MDLFNFRPSLQIRSRTAYEIGLESNELNLPDMNAKLIYSWTPLSSYEKAAPFSATADDFFGFRSGRIAALY